MLVKAKNMQYGSVAKFENEVKHKSHQLTKIFASVEFVRNETDKAIVAAAIKQGKQLIKRVGEARKALSAPLQEEIKRWIEKEKELIEPIEKSIGQADQRIQAYNQAVIKKQAQVLASIEAEEQK